MAHTTAAALLLLAVTGCAHPKPPRGGPSAPVAHTFRLLGLSADGRSQVEEAVHFESGAPPALSCHRSTPEGRVSVQRNVGCPAPGDDTLEPPGHFLVAEGTLPTRARLVLPGLGEVEVLLEQAPGPRGSRGVSLFLEGRGLGRRAVFHLPASSLVAASLYVAGRWLFVELEGAGVPSRFLRQVDLHGAAAALLEDSAREAVARGDLEAAQRKVESGLTLDASRATLHYLYACLRAKGQDPAGAIAALRTSFALEPRGLPGRARSDACFDPLRGVSDFDALVAPLGKRAPP